MDRKTFLEELKLREEVRKIIKIVYERRVIREQKEELALRTHIRRLIKEVADAGMGAQPNRSTGITVLDEEVLQNIIPIFKKYYMQLDNPEKRESFRSHIINAAENLLNTISSVDGTESDSAIEAEPAPLSEQDVSVGVSAKDDPMFIPVEDDKPDPEQSERDEFRSGLDSELSPDEEVGALRAQTAFNGPDTTIKKAYKDLRGEDAALFGEYLITNLKLHFDAMEEEISMTPEPTTPSYEEEVADGAPPGAEQPPPDEGGALPPETAPPLDAAPMPPAEEPLTPPGM